MKFLKQDELRLLLDNARNERDRLMMQVAFLHGLRATEVISLLPANIQNGYIDVQRLKGSKRTIQPLIVSEDPLFNEREALERWVKKFEKGERLFPLTRFGFYQIVHRAGARCGLPKHKCHPHAFKHSIAMASIKGAGVHVVQAYLGHKSLASTGKYLGVDDDTASQQIAAAAQIGK